MPLMAFMWAIGEILRRRFSARVAAGWKSLFDAGKHGNRIIFSSDRARRFAKSLPHVLCAAGNLSRARRVDCSASLHWHCFARLFGVFPYWSQPNFSRRVRVRFDLEPDSLPVLPCITMQIYLLKNLCSWLPYDLPQFSLAKWLSWKS